MSGHVDEIMSQLDPGLRELIGQPTEPPNGSPIPFAEPERAVSTKEIAKAEKEAAARAADRAPTITKTGRVSLSQKLRQLAPSAEKFKLYKRNTYGNLSFICTLTVREVEQTGDLEQHILRYLHPKYKGGEYVPMAIDARGNEVELGSVHIEDPAPGTAQDSALDLVRDLIAKTEHKMNTQASPPDPIADAIRQQIVDKIKSSMIEKKAEPMPQHNGMNGIMENMMQMMMLKALSPPEPPRTDPALTAILEKIVSRLDAVEKKTNEPLPLPPPPIPAVDPAAHTLAMIRELAPLLKPEPAPHDGPGWREIMEMQKNQSEQMIQLIRESQSGPAPDAPTWRDVISVMQERRAEEKPQASLMDQIQTVAMAKDALSKLMPPQQSSGTTFWDAIAAMTSQGGFAENMGQAIKLAVQNRPAQTARPVDIIDNRPAAHGQAHGQAPQFQPQPTAPLAPQNPAPAPLPMPSNMRELCTALSETHHDADRLDISVKMAFALHSVKQWSRYIEELLQKIVTNDQAGAIEGYIKPLFGLLVKNGLLSIDAAKATIQAFVSEWPAVQGEIAKRMAGLAPTPAVQAVAAPTAPTANQSIIPPAPAQATALSPPEDPEPALIEIPDKTVAQLIAPEEE